MGNDWNSIEAFEGAIPVFPLPNVAFFPQTLLPLHIFEPRYRAMVADVIEGDGLIAMALLRPAWEVECRNIRNKVRRAMPSVSSDFSATDNSLSFPSTLAGSEIKEKPAIMPTVCVGRIVKHEPLPDGCSNILLMGLSRALIEKELPCAFPYRVAQLSTLEDRRSDEAGADFLLDLRSRIGALCEGLSDGLDDESRCIRRILESSLPLGMIVDVLTATLPFDVYTKHAILAELDIANRAYRFLDYLNDLSRFRRLPSRQRPPTQNADYIQVYLN